MSDANKSGKLVFGHNFKQVIRPTGNGTACEVFFLWRPFLKDAKDDMVLEVALAGGCSAIVTYNVKDFAGVDQLGIEVLLPQEFLIRLQNNPNQAI